ncbi:J domain-containing protein [Desulfoscipio geothermicus]|uniref:DnaJ domain-containing protein n=1 Tax=Desulfoscipio geothermicus DSM 3669 TaxID=1121426 RepID=A0A1I6D106_9FIRM|nr:J domain-containing protein [Desulfoscipio geothermicus]SFQ99051.1 DnaJ domain-containing protein [Desulfoscipio geothermicus DSM 3669]
MVFPFSKKTTKRKKKQPVENYYKILNTRANASQLTIKKKYIEMVKMYPPETHPEEFQKIRQAYETLRDPVKRKEYDFLRKFGSKIEKLMDQAFYYFMIEDYDAAEDNLQKALVIAPEMPQIHIILANVALAKDNVQKFYEYFNLALKFTSEKDLISVRLLQATMLIDSERYEEALKILDAAREKYPDQAHNLNSAYLNVYMQLERYEEAWQLIPNMLPEPKDQTADDIHVYIGWINIMIEAEKWDKWSLIQNKVRKLIKSVTDIEDRKMMAMAFVEEHDDYYQVARFKEAEIFIDLACRAMPKDKSYAEKYRQTREMARFEKAFFRLQRDEDIIPLLSLYAFQWFYEDFLGPEMTAFYRKQLGEDFIRQMEQLDEFIVEGIMALKKKYPVIYIRFKAQWDDMITSRYGMLNREARRRLR